MCSGQVLKASLWMEFHYVKTFFGLPIKLVLHLTKSQLISDLILQRPKFMFGSPYAPCLEESPERALPVIYERVLMK